MGINYIYGVDIGGTTIKFGLFNESIELIEKWEHPTNMLNDGSYIISETAENILENMNKNNINVNQVIGVGIGIPGPIASEGIVEQCVNLGWGLTNVENEFRKYFNVKVRIGNDANVAALGEATGGAGKDYRDSVMFTIGTGVGGGVIIDNKLIVGKNGIAGELGHICVEPNDGLLCNCGLQGCLEQYASATGIVNLAKRNIFNEDEIYNLTAKEVFDQAIEGNDVYLNAVDEAATYIAQAMSIVSTVINPEIFIVGGGGSAAGDFLIEKIKRNYKELAFGQSRQAEIVCAELGNDAGIYGSAKLLKEENNYEKN